MSPAMIDLVQSVAGKGSDSYSLNVQTLIVITSLAFLPSVLLLMTCFTRIIVVLSVLRQALGLQTTPPNMILVALSLILTVFIMRGVLQKEQDVALTPYLNGAITFNQALAAAEPPIQAFMAGQTRKDALHLYVDLSGETDISSTNIPMWILVPAFATSELETGFQISFLIYLPFVLVDLAVAAILMALGMIMVSPNLVSLPLKLLMFVSIHGWVLVLGTLANSYLVK
ncbi:flagellar type III secretion system pore protein FliP [Acidocella sp.]|uniref:flagellar type III secretion system pore protein FliP n=1 Tax=Acidocella sp. TaxID=50710 RepID=UPI00262CD136|nr:flagellar type III secretion system pore protein FliP [Acidocella sp.]